MQGQLAISPDVMKALRENTAVVALESTIISHGMPYPQVKRLDICTVTAPGHDKTHLLLQRLRCLTQC